MSKSVVVMGCGWLGLPVAEKLIKEGYCVKGSTTSKEKISVLEAKNIKAFLIQLSEKEIIGNCQALFDAADTIVINIPPNLRKGQKENYVQKMQLLHQELLQSSIRKILFVSSTSVYGSIDGDVTENTTPQPSTESGKQLLEAEHLFQNTADFKTTILRFGGLIGNERHPINMLSGRKNLANGNFPINLIHLNDCVGIITDILKNNWWNEIINGVYPEHPTKKEYYNSKALEMNLMPPDYLDNLDKKGKVVIPFFLKSVKKYKFTTTL